MTGQVSDETDGERRAREAGRTARASAEHGWLRTLGRAGYAAKGVLWLLLGWIALQLAVGSSRQSPNQRGAFEQLAATGLGRALIVVMAAGLAAYAVWQAVEAIWGFRTLDTRHRAAKRVASAGRAVMGLALAGVALSVLARTGSAGSGQTERQLTAGALAVPGGAVIVAVVGLVLLGLGGYWVYRGWTAAFRDKLRPGVDRRLVAAGRVGHVARGAAIAVLGVLLVLAAARRDPSRAGGIDAAFGALLALPLGAVLLGGVAVGLMCFGLFQLARARHLEKRDARYLE